MRLTQSIVVFLLLTCVAAMAQPPSSDPIFGMVYDAKSVHFEQAPAVIAKCETYKPLKNKAFWLFAHAEIDGLEYFILSNRTTEDSGAGFIARGGQCVEWLPESMMAGESTLPGDKQGLPTWAAMNEAVVKALSQDAFRRYTQAFGGKRNFLAAVQKGGLAPKEMPRVLREELAAFSREP